MRKVCPTAKPPRRCASRIDWKYLLGLELDDPEFDFSVLSEFRDRVLAGGQEQCLLDELLARFRERGLLKARGKQRTDLMHVQAAVRNLNRLELVGETLRHSLNSLAQVAPAWLQERVPPAWYERYGPRSTQYRLPKAQSERQRLALQIGQDGWHVLDWVEAPDTPPEIQGLAALDILRQVWMQQYYYQDGQIGWRQARQPAGC